MDELLDHLSAAYHRRDHAALGYEDWAAYLAGEYGALPGIRDRAERLRVVTLLDKHGLSTRAIAPVIGSNFNTVARDLKSTVSIDTVEQSQNGASPKTGLDGRKRKAAKPKPKAPARAEKRKAEIAELHGIRQDGDEHKYQAMLAAPRAVNNRPLIDRAEKIEDLLGDLCALAPEDAVTMMPANRCREFTIERARWWLEFAEYCEKRRAEETPQLPPVKRWSRNAATNAVLAAAQKIPPAAERQLPPLARAAFDWLRDHEDWATESQIGIGISAATSALGNSLRGLVAADWLETGKDDRTVCYRIKATSDHQGDGTS
jgi:transposase